jgi:hypothetical protein
MATNVTKSDGASENSDTEIANGVAAMAWRRLGNRKKWPRKWWWPGDPEPETEDAAGTYQDQHDEASKTIRRVMLTIVGYSFFCMLTLSTPDSLLVSNNKIKIPFAQIDVGFADFLIVGPFVLLALVAYMHIFIAYWSHIPKRYVGKPLPFIFNMQGVVSRILAAILIYWLAPFILFLFAWKAQPYFPGNTSLFCLTTGLIAVMFWLQIRSRPAKTRKHPGYFGLWIGCLIFSAITIKLGAALTVSSAAYVAKSSETIGPQLLIALGFGEEKAIQVASRPTLEPSARRRESPPRPANPGNIEQEQSTQQIQQTSLSRGLNLGGTDLKTAKLDGKDFRNANLRKSILNGQRFIGTPYEHIDFSGANMEQASLVNADFAYASFIGVNLRGANFRGATFKLVLFSRTDLRNVDFTEAEFDKGDLNMSSTDIRGAKGLDCESLLRQEIRWDSLYRDKNLECGKPFPPHPRS